MKKKIRNEVKNKRNILTLEEKKKYAKEIAEKLFETKEWEKAKKIMSYMDFMNEVETNIIHKKAFEEGKVLLLPKIFPGSKEMRAIVTENMEDYIMGKYGIREPKGNIEEEPDLVIVPGVAFDLDGNRIGYGGGYYDKYLNNRKCFKIAIAYNFQIYNRVEVEEHDIPMDKIISNNK